MKNNSYTVALGKQRGRCPACGRRTLKLYQRTDGSIIHPECGRCNREIKCAYHKPPREFPTQQDYRIAPQARAPRRDYNRDYELHPERYFLTPGWLEIGRELNNDDVFLGYLRKYFSDNVILRAYVDLYVRYCYFMSDSVVFWQVDSQGRIRSGKVMRYGHNGHRAKDGRSGVNFIHALEEENLPNFNYQMCYFGEHFASIRNGAKILVVESEKTAVLLHCILNARDIHGYVPLAVGGASCLSIDHYMMQHNMLYRNRIFRDRDIILLPDADMVEQWQTKVPDIAQYAASVKLVDTRAKFRLTGSEDVGDFIERFVKAREAKYTEECYSAQSSYPFFGCALGPGWGR